MDEEKFSCDEILDYEYSVFDVITELLESQGGKAKKGYGRRRLGDPGCEETTVAGAIMKTILGNYGEVVLTQHLLWLPFLNGLA
ncbi:MAG: hypothetical protein V8T17_01575 [Oscillospiraceae bacterium]